MFRLVIGAACMERNNGKVHRKEYKWIFLIKCNYIREAIISLFLPEMEVFIMEEGKGFGYSCLMRRRGF